MSDKPNKSNKTDKEAIMVEDDKMKIIEADLKIVAKKGSSTTSAKEKATKKKPKTTTKAKATINVKGVESGIKQNSEDSKLKNADKKTFESNDSVLNKVKLVVKESKKNIKEKSDTEKKQVKDKNKSKATIKKASSKIQKKTKTETKRKTSKKNQSIAKAKIQSKDVSVVEKDNIVEDKSKITNFNKYLFHQGKNYSSYDILGSHVRTEEGKLGVQFATWAPNALQVYVVGDFNDFNVSEEYKLEKVSENGLWKGFFTKPQIGSKYKYCIIDKNGKRGEYKADPYAIQSELRPNNASIVYEAKDFKWNDKSWMDKRKKANVLEQPLNIYEIHLGSWKRKSNGEFLTYEELSKTLPKYVKEMGYTHIELMPLVEHPLDASWGYQGTGYFSPTSRYGNIEGLKKLINKLHEENIGVIMDWVPGHFCKDAHGLYKFDGTPTYEYQDEWRAENKGWGTCNFDLGRCEVKSYLISNALYWFEKFHIDGLRVDAVSSILYLDYSRQPGEWVPNKFGGNGNLEAIDFLKQLNTAVFAKYPTALMIAEESTAWPNVTKPASEDGLGFNFKWNMGWMNDTLEYIKIDPKYRKNNHRNITFAMMYNYAENYLLPLSHDEVVHGKKSLVEKMWGDEWNKYAGLRAFIGYMMGHPGKKLTFMGCEFGQEIEWREYEELEWNMIDDNEINKKTKLFFKEMNHFYLNNKALWEFDHDPKGFNWIEADNSDQSILIFERKSSNDKDTLVFIINFTPKVYYDYRIGVPFLGVYEEAFNTDDSRYGGSGQIMGTDLVAETIPFHNKQYSLKIKVPPMATLILRIKDMKDEDKSIDDIKVKDIESDKEN